MRRLRAWLLTSPWGLAVGTAGIVAVTTWPIEPWWAQVLAVAGMLAMFEFAYQRASTTHTYREIGRRLHEARRLSDPFYAAMTDDEDHQ